MTDPSNRPLGELEREVEASRTRLELALNDLGRQFTVDGLVATVKNQLSDEPLTQRADQLITKAKNNPLPVALIGAGLGWLLFGDGGPDSRTIRRGARHGAERALHGAENIADSAMHGAASLAGSAREGAEHLAGSVSHGASAVAGSAKHGAASVAGSARQGAASVAGSAKQGAAALTGSGQTGAQHPGTPLATAHGTTSGPQTGTAGTPQALRHDIYGRPIASGREFQDHDQSLTDRARHALSDAGDSVGERAHALGHSASGLAEDARHHLRETGAQSVEMMHRARDEVRHAYQTNPVVLGLGVAAVASLVGVLLPNSRREDEAMGPYAREAKYRAQEAAGEALDQAEEAAGSLIGKAEAKADEVMEKSDKAVGKAEAAAGDAIDKAGEAARNTGRKVEEKIATAGKKDESPKPGSAQNKPEGASKEKAGAN